ncbi:hypothetical protein [Amycolatopsis marina]|uniref:hypothetical protein n=1 Tax=Amycolatopsis marina TaxID=490629 RepID=UPI000AA1FD84|nr:hypothetical protein [Amycolatopsis marina]
MNDADIERTRTQLQRGLRVAILFVGAVIVFGLGLSNMARRWESYDLPLAQAAAFGTLAVVLATEAVLLVRRVPWRPCLRRSAVAVVLAASVLSYATMPDERSFTAMDWAFGAANWVGTIVLLDRPIRVLVAFLLAHELTAGLHLLVFGDVSRAVLLRFATGSVNVIGFPLCVAIVAVALRRIATTAAATRYEIERIRTADAVAAESHRRRQQRFAELSSTTVPLLEGLADGSCTPGDPGVQQRCAVEAARMRRLFAEVDNAADPLLHELRHCADIADRKGVLVEVDTRGQWPVLPVAVRRDLTEAALTALATAASWARITVVGEQNLVSVNVVADCGAVRVAEPAAPGVRVENVSKDDTLWVEAQWQPVR